MDQHDHKQVITLSRALLTNCQSELVASGDYGLTLSTLASALTDDGQSEEALAVAERCIQTARDNLLSCMVDRARALLGMRRVEEARSALNKAAAEPALTEVDVAAKRLARALISELGPGSTAARIRSKPPTPRGKASIVRYGTGFFVSVDGHIVTNFHVVEGCRTIETPKGVRLTILKSNRKADLALLHAGDAFQGQVAVFRANDVAVGEPIVVYGFPLAGILSSAGNVTTGIVSATAGLQDNPLHVQISAPVRPGNSGGPLLDQFGNVVGVVVSKLDALKISGLTGDIPQNINFAVKGVEVTAFIERSGIKSAIGTMAKVLTTEDIAKKAQSFSIQIVCAR